MKNVLIVGGAGYIGGAVTDTLSGLDDVNVRVYDNLLYEESFRKPVDFISGDIRDICLLKQHLEWADAVIWLAALVGDGACALNPELTVALNQDSVRWLSENYKGRIIFMSTCSVYGAQESEIDEDSQVNPLSVYALTKYNAESYLKNKNALIFRLGTLFGVGDLFSRIRLDLVVNILVVRAALEKKLTVFGGDQFRPLLHVRDVAKTISENLFSDYRGVFNLHKQNVRIVDLAYQVRNHFPDADLITTDINFQDARNYRVKSEKARSILNFKPIYSIDDGISEVKELVESRRLRDVKNPRYSNQAFLTNNISGLESCK